MVRKLLGISLATITVAAVLFTVGLRYRPCSSRCIGNGLGTVPRLGQLAYVHLQREHHQLGCHDRANPG